MYFSSEILFVIHACMVVKLVMKVYLDKTCIRDVCAYRSFDGLFLWKTKLRLQIDIMMLLLLLQ